MQKGNLILFVLMLILMVTGALIYTKSSVKKQASEQKIRLTVTVDSVRTATVDSMKKLIQKQISYKLPAVLAQSAPTIELYDLINLFVPDDTINYDLLDWKTGANNPAINWQTNGIEMGNRDFYREGSLVVSINKQVIECLDRNAYPCKWDITLLGPRGGYTSFKVSSIQSQALAEMSIEELFKNNKFEAKILKTDEFNSKTYLVKFPNKKSIEMAINWSCGSAGCSVNIKCRLEL